MDQIVRKINTANLGSCKQSLTYLWSARGKRRVSFDHFGSIFIGPESDHWLCLSLTHSLTHSCLVNLIDVTLACEDANSILVEVVTVDAEKQQFGADLEAEVWS